MIHQTAIIDPQAELGSSVAIAPYTVIEGPVTIGENCRIGPHCHITGHTTIGPGARVHAGAVVGGEPQDYDYGGERSYTVIGAGCHLREYVTIHRGATPESTTSLGNNVMIMAFGHVAHNCRVADNVVLVNGVTLGGHVEIGARAFVSACTQVHQFVRIGELAMLGSDMHLRQDVAPYCMAIDDGIVGPNVVGLRRAGIDSDGRRVLKNAIRTFTGERPQAEALAAIEAASPELPAIENFVTFVRSSKRGVMRAAGTGRRRI
ncbi:MAG: acyl-ACP--UDP-N-acetylglucosamine O-acyltransferase [Lentisphaeria bacterium]|jgi:UDP-N-acetylglucosamine acyltransferase|nr:acyl-ACP--UDP-N-acetylglucosamine O-acyltransferase [Lentisphaeria bacterium]